MGARSELFDHARLTGLLHETLQAATLWHKTQGCRWYWEAHRFAKELARRYDYTLCQVAATIATLSPGTRWDINMRDAETFCKAAREGADMPSVTTYGPQARKAWVILHIPAHRAQRMTYTDWDRYIGTDSALKTRSFFRNIADPTIRDVVTIDRWICRALDLEGRERLTTQQYMAVEKAFNTLAEKHDTQAHKIQATVWIAVQEYWNREQESIPF